MRKFVMGITYKPKIEPIRSGCCTQTIRKGEKVHAGDSILFHGWFGRPYRSKWTWMYRVNVSHVHSINVYESGFECENGVYYAWRSKKADELAALDIIDPPTGIELRKVLSNLNNEKKTDRYIDRKYQIIRWG